MIGYASRTCTAPKAGVTRITQKDGHDLKVLAEEQLDVGILRGWYYLTRFHNYWIQPVWDGDSCNAEWAIELATKTGGAGAGDWRVSLQQHKYLGIR